MCFAIVDGYDDDVSEDDYDRSSNGATHDATNPIRMADTLGSDDGGDSGDASDRDAADAASVGRCLNGANTNESMYVGAHATLSYRSMHSRVPIGYAYAARIDMCATVRSRTTQRAPQ